MRASRLGPALGPVGVGQAVVGAGLIGGLVERGRQFERLPVGFRGRGGLVSSLQTMRVAECVQRGQLAAAVSDRTGQVQRPLVVVGRLLVPALQSVDVPEAPQRGQLTGPVAAARSRSRPPGWLASVD